MNLARMFFYSSSLKHRVIINGVTLALTLPLNLQMLSMTLIVRSLVLSLTILVP